MTMELVLASTNEHKVTEITLLMPSNLSVIPMSAIGCNDDIAETGNTFAENASLKSQYLYNKYGVNCFADDSGLEIEALNGEPGIFSARYAGSRDMEKNIERVLQQLKGITNRKAQFKTVISLIINGKEWIFEGTIRGSIRNEKCGIQGFGYDPIFQPDGYSKTFAEMTLEEKNTLSHRKKALLQMLDHINKN